MSTQIAQTTAKDFFSKDAVKSKFNELLGERATAFITSVLQIATSNKLLATADPSSIYNAACMAATLDLPINQNLGYAYIVPYAGKAQFQIGYKGIIQLAQRTGQYLKINVVEVYENQFESFNALTEELKADFTKEPQGKIVGYCAYFKLLNGYEKTIYWTHEKVERHAKRYSKSFGNGVWKDEFEKMAKKTVLKHCLSTWGILSVEMQSAVTVDQTVIKDIDTLDVEHIDLNLSNDEKIKKAKEQITDALEFLSQKEADKIRQECVELSNAGLFTLEKANEIAKTIGIELEF